MNYELLIEKHSSPRFIPSPLGGVGGGSSAGRLIMNYELSGRLIMNYVIGFAASLVEEL